MKNFIAILALFLFCGCDEIKWGQKYQFYFDKAVLKDTLIRTNSETGTVVMLFQSGEVMVFDKEFIKNSNILQNNTSIPPVEKKFSFANSKTMWAKIKYRWCYGRVLYKFSFGRYSKQLDDVLTSKNINYIKIIFYDSYGFKVKELSISPAITRVIDESGKVAYWEIEGKSDFPVLEYSQISDVSYVWLFSDKLNELIDKIDLIYTQTNNHNSTLSNKYNTIDEVSPYLEIRTNNPKK